MNLFFSFYDGDSDLALKSAKAIVKMGPNMGHKAFVCCPNSTPNIVDITMELRKVFSDVERIAVQDGFNGWPLGPNQMFSDAAVSAYTKEGPWYFWEPDCVPMRAGWMDLIEQEHGGGATILGTIYDAGMASNGKELKKMIVGSAVYPSYLIDMCPLVRHLHAYNFHYRESGITPDPWDVRSRWEFLKFGKDSSLIKTYWKSVNYQRSGNKIVFYAEDPEANAIQNVVCPDRTVDPNAAVVHGCKDGSLHDLVCESSSNKSEDYSEDVTYHAGALVMAYSKPVDMPSRILDSPVKKRATKKKTKIKKKVKKSPVAPLEKLNNPEPSLSNG